MAETVREVPLSLQVFHSHNEYKAHRRNRTEQIYLRDLSAGLGREEKLYVKDYAFQRSSFHRHYARRFSAPLLSAPSAAPSRAATAPTSAIVSTPGVATTSRLHLRSARSSSASVGKNGGGGVRPVSQSSPHASVFSASASLRHVTSSANNSSSSSSTPLAVKMLDGLKEMSVSTRFQRIQRKFSIASMTENGCLTATGDALANDIQEARKLLFKKGSLGAGKSRTNVRDVLAKLDAENSRRSSMSRVEEVEEKEHGGDSRPATHCLKEVAGKNSVQLNADKLNDHAAEDLKEDSSDEKPGTLDQENSTKPSDADGDENRTANGKSVVIDPRMKMPFLKLRANLNFSKQRNAKAPGHVTITEPIPEAQSTRLEETVEGEPEEEDDDTPSHSELFSQQTSSIFKRFLTNTPYTEPLQMKIRAFLQDQNKFNQRFPKGEENRENQSERHKELLSGEKEKKEKMQEEHKKKKEIVFEVLTKLGITDEHVWFHYDQ